MDPIKKGLKRKTEATYTHSSFFLTRPMPLSGHFQTEAFLISSASKGSFPAAETVN